MATKAQQAAARRRRLNGDAIPRTLLAAELQHRIRSLGLNRNEAAALVDDAASQMSRLMTGHITDFSADRIVKMLLRLGSDVRIHVVHNPAKNPKRIKRGRIQVSRVPARTVRAKDFVLT